MCDNPLRYIGEIKMDILDVDLQQINFQKQNAFRLMATKVGGKEYFDWTIADPDKASMIHDSLRRLRRQTLPDEDKEKLQDILPPIIVAANKDNNTIETMYYASEKDNTPENLQKLSAMKSRISIEFHKFTTLYFEKNKTSTFDGIFSESEQQAALYDSIPDAELFKSPRNMPEANMRRAILEARKAKAPKGSYEWSQYRHFLGY